MKAVFASDGGGDSGYTDADDVAGDLVPMRATCNEFESGWIGITLELRPEEVDVMIDRLQSLKGGSIGHFHIVQEKWSGKTGIADIEVSINGGDQPDDMVIG